MIEDKLEHDERLRLECLAQANMRLSGASAEQIIDTASRFEHYIRTGEK